MEKRRLLIIFAVVLIFSVHGCYTSFTHPPINDPRWGTVHYSDDCSECHDHSRYTPPVLPAAAEQDNYWQFYSGSAWWQDEYAVGAGVAADPDEQTGPRAVTSTPLAPAPVAMPVQGTTQSLGKKSAAAQQNETETPKKRTVGRRTHTSPSTETTTDSKKSSSRSRRE
ncbi:hypothetical protein JXA70_05755 [candidate division KSB1 bacterium]|nr:hypothetical protein [candidate division KSB1 bacterium]